MATENRGLYVHIPFCKSKCKYCDFCSSPKFLEQRSQYIFALGRELEFYSKHNTRIDSIFFGGGTPSLLSAEEFDYICEKIDGSFKRTIDTEFTLEVNPKTLTEEKLISYKKNGVNRISFGVQTIHENELKKLGRIHTFEDFVASYNLARSFGFDNISVDLMYGIPDQSIDSFRESLNLITRLRPEHISVYGLIIEEGTPFYEMRDSLNFPSEDEECMMYYLASEILASSGYSHYEISNYAKESYECKHNLKYWRDEEYIGVGLAAHSYFLGARYSNTTDLEEYIKYSSAPKISADIKGKDPEEYAMLRLRLKEGVSLEEYKRIFDRDFLSGKEQSLRWLMENGYMGFDKERVFLTEKGFYVSNSIIAEFM